MAHYALMMALLIMTCVMIIVLYKKYANSLVSPVAVVSYLFFLYFVFRPFSICFLGEARFPQFLPAFERDYLVLIEAQLYACWWLLMLIVGMSIKQKHSSFHTFSPPQIVSCTKAVMLAMPFIIIALVLIVVVYSVAPSDIALAYFVRIEKGMGALTVALDLIPMGMVMLVWLYLKYKYEKKNNVHAIILLFCFFMLVWFAIYMGSRKTVVVPLIILVFGMLQFSTAIRQKKVSFLKIIIVFMVLTSTVVILKELRTNQITQNSNVLHEKTFLESFSLGMNLNAYDGFASVIKLYRDDNLSLRMGQDVILALVSIVPRALWREKPDAVNLGVIFVREFDNNRVMGLPITALGEWYYNFGPFGAMLGGLFSGYLLRKFLVLFHDWRLNHLSYISFMYFILGVYTLGINSAFLRRFIIYMFPLFIIIYAMKIGRGSRPSIQRTPWFLGR